MCFLTVLEVKVLAELISSEASLSGSLTRKQVTKVALVTSVYLNDLPKDDL